MSSAEERSARALEDISASCKKFVKIFETINTNMVEIGQRLPSVSIEMLEPTVAAENIKPKFDIGTKVRVVASNDPFYGHTGVVSHLPRGGMVVGVMIRGNDNATMFAPSQLKVLFVSKVQPHVKGQRVIVADPKAARYGEVGTVLDVNPEQGFAGVNFDGGGGGDYMLRMLEVLGGRDFTHDFTMGQYVRILDEAHERFNQIGVVNVAAATWIEVLFQDGGRAHWVPASLEHVDHPCRMHPSQPGYAEAVKAWNSQTFDGSTGANASYPGVEITPIDGQQKLAAMGFSVSGAGDPPFVEVCNHNNMNDCNAADCPGSIPG